MVEVDLIRLSSYVTFYFHINLLYSRVHVCFYRSDIFSHFKFTSSFLFELNVKRDFNFENILGIFRGRLDYLLSLLSYISVFVIAVCCISKL